MKKQKKCYIYTRVSIAIQVDGYSLDAQKEKLRKYAEYQDMTIVSEFSDEDFSGKNIKGRPEFTRMMEKIESGEDGVDFVLVFKLSRFGRNAADVLNFLQTMQDFLRPLLEQYETNVPFYSADASDPFAILSFYEEDGKIRYQAYELAEPKRD